MKAQLTFIFLLYSYFAFSQINKIKEIPVPNGLSETSDAIEIYSLPNPDYGEIVKNKFGYEVMWNHSTYIVAHKNVTITELGACLLFNGAWRTRAVFKESDMKRMFKIKSLTLKKGDTISYTDNVRYDNYSSTGWNFWYVKGTTKNGTEHNSLDYLETKGISSKGEVLMPLLNDSSLINWTGKAGDSDYQLTGTINAMEGAMLIQGDTLRGGSIYLIMDSLSHENKDLVGHLKSKDFFNVKKYRGATFMISNVVYTANDNYKLVGDLKMLGVTNSESTIAVLEEFEKQYCLTFDLVIDRTKYGMTYASSLDTKSSYSIADEIKISARLVFRKDYPGSLPWNTFEKP